MFPTYVGQQPIAVSDVLGRKKNSKSPVFFAPSYEQAVEYPLGHISPGEYIPHARRGCDGVGAPEDLSGQHVVASWTVVEPAHV